MHIYKQSQFDAKAALSGAIKKDIVHLQLNTLKNAILYLYHQKGKKFHLQWPMFNLLFAAEMAAVKMNFVDGARLASLC